MTRHACATRSDGRRIAMATLRASCLTAALLAFLAPVALAPEPASDISAEVNASIEQAARFSPFHPRYMVGIGEQMPDVREGRADIPSAEDLRLRVTRESDEQAEWTAQDFYRVVAAKWILKDAAKRILWVRDWPFFYTTSALLVYDIREERISVYLRHHGYGVTAAFKPRWKEEPPNISDKEALAVRVLGLLREFLVAEAQPKDTSALLCWHRFGSIPAAGLHYLRGQYRLPGPDPHHPAALLSYSSDGTYLKVRCTWPDRSIMLNAPSAGDVEKGLLPPGHPPKPAN